MVTLEVGDGQVINFLNQMPIGALIKRVENEGYACVSKDEQGKYVNITKSMGTEPFYDMLVDAIEKGELNLELLIGRVAVNKIVGLGKNSNNTKKK